MTNTTNTESREKAEAWLNLKIQDNNGEYHNIKCYIPLTKENNVHAALIKRAREIEQYEVETGKEWTEPFIIHGSINLVKKAPVQLAAPTNIPTEIREHIFTPAEPEIEQPMDMQTQLNKMQQQIGQVMQLLNKATANGDITL